MTMLNIGMTVIQLQGSPAVLYIHIYNMCMMGPGGRRPKLGPSMHGQATLIIRLMGEVTRPTYIMDTAVTK